MAVSENDGGVDFKLIFNIYNRLILEFSGGIIEICKDVQNVILKS